MNEKLFEIASELSKQASDWVDEVYPSAGYKPRARQNHYRTKFAELIIQECIEQCYADYDSKEDWDKGVRWAVKQIKEHFGVE